MKGIKRKIIGIMIVFCVVFLSSKILFAALNVPSEYSTIQAAIDAAVDGCVIIVAPGIYLENIDFLGKAITVRSTDPVDTNVIATTIIDANQRGSVVTFSHEEETDSVLTGFTVRNGQGDYGGGICCTNNSSPTITNCIIENNIFSSLDRTSRGGGIYCEYSSPMINKCTIRSNTSRCGGGIHCFFSSPKVTDCTIEHNTSTARPGGGGIYCISSSPTIDNCTIRINNASYGGGIYFNSSSPTITNCAINGNIVIVNGGGIYCTESSPIITNCTVTNNEAQFGGWILCEYNSFTTITNCTVADNRAQSGGGIVCSYDSSLTITNCILWNNLPQEITEYNTPIVTYSDIQGGYEGKGNIDADPLFINPNYYISPNSPCIDTGDPNSLIFEDKDGLTRPQDGDGDGVAICDMGAYESPRLNTYYQDADEDGYGDPNTPLQSCFQPDGYVPDGTDCLDSDPNIHPTAIEYVDGKDNDCDREVDEPNDLTNGLLAFYPFNGNANDESGNRHHGTVYGAGSVEDRFWSPNNAYSFDGIDDYIHIGIMGVTPQSGTIAFWMKPTSVENYRSPFSTFIDRGDEAIIFQEHYGKLVVVIGSGGSNFRYHEFDNIHANAFCYVVFLWDKETNICRGWLNGVKKFENTHNQWPSEFFNVGVGICSISRTGSYHLFEGTIDDIRIYNRALSESEIWELYCEGLPSDTYYLDADKDGYGDPNYTIQNCVIPPGYVENKNDCDDSDPNVYPGAPEQCNGKDNDCDGEIDFPLSLGCRIARIENAQGSPGQIHVVVPIMIEGAAGIAGGDITLSYDPEILTAQEVRPGGLINGFFFQSNVYLDKGIISLVFANATGITSNGGVLVEIIIDVYESAPIGNVSPLVFAEMIANNQNAEHIDIIPQNGEFEVICDRIIFYRDIDGDRFGATEDSRCLDAPDPNGIYTALVPGDLNDNDPAVFPRTLRVLDAQDYPGQTQVKVLIEVEDAAQITEAGFVLKYDPNVLIAKEVRPPFFDDLCTQTDIHIFPIADLNKDWYVDQKDVDIVQDVYLCFGLPGCTLLEYPGADVNHDGQVDILDIVLTCNDAQYGFYILSNINQSEGEVYWKAFSARGLSSDRGILAEIIFDVSESAMIGTTIPLILENTYVYIKNSDLCGALTTDGEFLIVEEGYKGDLNKDKDITSADAIFILQGAVGKRTLDEYQIWAGDVNEDGYINSADAILVLKAAVGIPTIFSSRPKSGQPGDMITIIGWNFGDTQGDSGVFFEDIKIGPNTWSDSKIIITVPSGIEPGPVYISIDTIEDISNPYRFIIGEEQMTRHRGFDPHFKLADNTRTIYVPSDLIAAPCEQIVIPIEIDDAAGIAGMDLVLEFNPDVLIPVDVERASLTEGFLLGMNDSGEGSLMVSLASPTGITEGNGALVDLVFEVSPDAQESYPTGLTIHPIRLYDENAELIEAITPINGQNAVLVKGNSPTALKINSYEPYFYHPVYYPRPISPIFPQSDLRSERINPLTSYHSNSYGNQYVFYNLNGWMDWINSVNNYGLNKKYNGFQDIYHWPPYNWLQHHYYSPELWDQAMLSLYGLYSHWLQQ